MKTCDRVRHRDSNVTLERFQTEQLKEVSHYVVKASRTRGVVTAQRNARVIESMRQNSGAWKRACVSATHDLKTNREELNAAALMPDDIRARDLRKRANVDMMGLIFYKSYGGRPGEWMRLSRKHADTVVSTNATYIAVDVHKTKDTFGTLGRCVPARLGRGVFD